MTLHHVGHEVNDLSCWQELPDEKLALDYESNESEEPEESEEEEYDEEAQIDEISEFSTTTMYNIIASSVNINDSPILVHNGFAI